MKRSVLGMCGIAVATAMLAHADVTSVNVVGFNKLTFERGKLHLVSMAFEDINGNPLKSTDLFGNQLPNGSQVFYYDGVTPYKTDNKTVGGWGTNITYRGTMGFWVRVPSGAGGNIEVVFKGQVPMANSISNVIVTGLNMVAYPYTADMAFTNTAFFAQSVNGDRLHIFNSSSQTYSNYSRAVGTWPVGARNTVFTQGMGFWYNRSGSTFLATEARPYPSN